jgi:uridine kinase
MNQSTVPVSVVSSVLGADSSDVRAIVTVDGIDGSGKSTFARRLIDVLGPRGVLFSVDDFRRPIDWARTDHPELWLYYHQRYDLVALDACLNAFRDGKPSCRFRGFDGAREALGEEREITFGEARVAVVEGVFVARLRSAVDALSVYMDIPRDEAARRVRERDLGKGRTREEVDRRIEQRYFPAHDRYVSEQQPRDRAAVVLDNRDPRLPRVMRARFPSSPGWVTVRAALERLLDDSPHA